MQASPSLLVTLEALFESMLIGLHSASFTPFAARTQQFVKEQLGQAEDKVRQRVPPAPER
jgi:hypothetical protein